MKRVLICLSFLTATTLLFSQTANEVALFSQTYNFNATARSMGMGGAVGALHSEYASININPATLGTFRGGLLIITPELEMKQATTDFYNTKSAVKRNSYLVSSAGAVYSFSNNNMDFNRFNLSFGYAGGNNFNNYYDVIGQPAANHSIIQLFTNSGGIDQYALSFGTSYLDQIYIGLTAGLSDLNFDQNARLNESIAEGGGEPAGQLSERTTTMAGMGFNARLGIMYAPMSDLTIGVAVQSPIFYSLSANIIASKDLQGDDTNAVIPYDEDSYDFTLRTPWRFSLSAAYEAGTRTTLSLDYEVVTNNMTALDGDFFNMSESAVTNIREINDLISNDFNLAMNVRVGGEVRFNQFYTRAGFAYIGAPSKTVGSMLSGAAGVGLRLTDASVDLAYRYATASEELSVLALPALATINKEFHQILLTFSYRF